MVQLRVLAFLLGLRELYPGAWSLAIGDRNSTNIVEQISIQEAPYMAALFLNDEYTCGASIINVEFVLTAAQCIYGSNDNDTWEVLVGSNDINTGGTLIEVKNKICHEKYDDVTTDNDICILKLYDPVPLGCIWNVGIVRLPQDERTILDGTMVNVFGWGYTDRQSNKAVIGNKLRRITVPIVSKESCQGMRGKNLTNQICAGDSRPRVCVGDIGGPLVYNGVQIGVISYGWSNCGKNPTVFTDIGIYLSWIADIIKINKTV